MALPSLHSRIARQHRIPVGVAREYWPSIGAGAFGLWVLAAVLLSVPWIICWTRRSALRPWTTAAATILGVLPPLCIVGWASPLVSAGVLFPNSGWLGVIATIAFPALLLVKRMRITAVSAASVAALFLNTHAKQISPPKTWEAEMTHIHRARVSNDIEEFTIEEHLQSVAVSSKRSVLVFPEGSVRRWTDATDAFWTAALADSHQILVIGAVQPIERSPNYNNSVVILKGPERDAVQQRIPVPGGMWNPLMPRSFALNLFDPGVAEIGGERATILICYEQLIVWPMLRSAAEGRCWSPFRTRRGRPEPSSQQFNTHALGRGHACSGWPLFQQSIREVIQMQEGIKEHPILTINEVATILRCSKTHVSHVLAGKIPGIPKLAHIAVGRRKLVRREWLEEWMEANRIQC